MTGSVSTAVVDIVNTAKTAVNRKLTNIKNRNFVGSSTGQTGLPPNERRTAPVIAHNAQLEMRKNHQLMASCTDNRPSSQSKQTQHRMGMRQLNASALRIQ
jgi:hypothetical protein